MKLTDKTDELEAAVQEELDQFDIDEVILKPNADGYSADAVKDGSVVGHGMGYTKYQALYALSKSLLILKR